MDLPLVSILIRSMNRPSLQAALESVAAQTYPHIEIIVVNASGKPHSPLDPRTGSFPLRLIDSGTPLPRSQAANTALENAIGEYALFLDDDDWFDPAHIETLVEKLHHNRHAILAYSGTVTIDEHENIIGTFDYEYSKEQIYIANFMPIHSVLFRSNAFGMYQCRFDESLAIYEDWDFWIQLAQYGDFVRAPRISAFYRIADGGSSDAHHPEAASKARAQVFHKWQHRWSNDIIVFIANQAVEARAVDPLRQETKDLRLEIQNLYQHIETLRHDNHLLQGTLNAVLNSRSWKVTSIARNAKKLITSPKTYLQRFSNKIKFWYNETTRQLEIGNTHNGNILFQSTFVERSGSMLCLFSHFDRDGIIDPYVIHYLQALHDAGCDIVFVSTASGLNDTEIAKIDPFCAQVIIKENIGYDFGAWKSAIEMCKERLSAYDRMILCNDSVYAPLFDLHTMFHTMQNRQLDMWGITESRDMGYHLQSYFVVFEKTVLNDPDFLTFWDGYKVYRHKRNIIERYEVGLSHFMKSHGYRIGAYCPTPETLPVTTNITHFYWDRLIREQCPIIKIELLRDNPMERNLSEVQTLLTQYAHYPFELIRDHLQRVSKKGKMGLLEHLES